MIYPTVYPKLSESKSVKSGQHFTILKTILYKLSGVNSDWWTIYFLLSLNIIGITCVHLLDRTALNSFNWGAQVIFSENSNSLQVFVHHYTFSVQFFSQINMIILQNDSYHWQSSTCCPKQPKVQSGWKLWLALPWTSPCRRMWSWL